jgi:predicted PurR-regulated permease PerM
MIDNILIIILILLIIYNMITYFFSDNIIESYENYSDDPMILAQKNAGNIEDIKSQLDELKKNSDTMETTLNTVKDQSDSNTNNITSIMSGQKKAGEQVSSKMSEIS